MMMILYGVSLGLGMYTFLSTNDKPYEYGTYSPIIIILFVIYYSMFYLCMYKVEAYKNRVNIILDEFEEEHKCKIRIRQHKKGFEINWNPNLSNKKEKGKAKGKTDKQLNLSKGKMAKNKVNPLPRVKKDTEE